MKNLILAISLLLLTSILTISCSDTPKENESTNKIETKTSTKKPIEVIIIDGEVIEAETATFNQIVTQSTIPVIIDFTATWCQPCRMMKPFFKGAAKELSGKVRFVSIDVDKNRQLAQQFNIQSLPSLVLLKDNKELTRRLGYMPQTAILQFANESLK